MLMGEEFLLNDLRSEATRVTAICDPSESVEVDAQVQSCIVTFNQLCNNIVEAHTKYTSSLVLWERFNDLEAQTNGWAKEAQLKVAKMTARSSPEEEEAVKVLLG